MNLVVADVSRRICLFSRQRISADSRRRLRFRALMREIFRGNPSMTRLLVAASRQSAAGWLLPRTAALCRDAATVHGHNARLENPGNYP